MKVVLLESHYIPSIAYFAALLSGDEALLETHENFQKQTYRNRCYINTSQGIIPLIVPLANASGKTLITDIKIDYSQRWQNNHWRAIQSSYGKAPFFEYYADDLRAVLFNNFARLFDLNSALLTLCLRWLKCKITVRGTSVYEKSPLQPIYDLRSTITPKNSTRLHEFYDPAVYHQVFGNKFVENLSLIDLIFCEGPGALGIVQASTRK
ncbi:MAG TPA: WbqC family protein [Chryseosolibacter sp.]